MTYEQKIDRLANTKDPVPIHDLYSNSLFEFRFPMSETQSYYLLQDCLVALYYQLYFLKQQCNWKRQDTSGDGFGWAFCRYGEGVNSDECGSWICPKAKAASSTGNDENAYDKVLASHTQECGQNQNGGSSGGTPSPLQAFLTDCLPGFTCWKVYDKIKEHCKKPSGIANNGNYQKCYLEFLEHRGHCPPGQYCPIPMGFSGCFRDKTTGGAGPAAAGNGIGMSGLGINAITSHYANDDLTDSCLYQLTRCISSLTRRVPRSTGTLYGFFYGLVDVYSDGGGNGQAVTNSLVNELQCYPGTCNPINFINSLYNWRGMTHTKDNTNGKEKPGSHEHGTLDSLNKCGEQCNTEKATCGWYLKPLSGCMYNSVSRVYCDTYLSWILYLSGRLQDGLKALRDAFLGISCEDCKCKNASQCKSGECKKGTHGKSDSTSSTKGCCCNSVVDCVGVHGLFYRFGFTYNSPGYLTHTGQNGDNYKRTCQQFYQRLEKVINGDYYTQLSEQLRKFIYTTRLPFGLVIFGFWTAVLGYLLWSITGPLDLLHIQSHWRSPRSYLVPLQRILADGSRKGFCTLGYFQENTGDRLLSLGVSDVYL